MICRMTYMQKLHGLTDFISFLNPFHYTLRNKENYTYRGQLFIKNFYNFVKFVGCNKSIYTIARMYVQYYLVIISKIIVQKDILQYNIKV